MRNSRRLIKSAASWPLVLAATLAVSGCAQRVDVGQVSGQVLDAAGKPLDSVRVNFMPDPNKATEGRMSWAITDEEGRFQLEYQDDVGGPGAAMGWHQVTLNDIAGENFRGDGPPPKPRISVTYANPSTTPFSFEVIAGEQTIDLQIK